MSMLDISEGSRHHLGNNRTKIRD